ncbi:hypothetical protein [Mycobacterium sp. AZCC_0083]|uniref:hypothetical protein n=1 Tax=Mycobacterium sp. AZCC_0083 TaxID=2735882 RepID=UPI0016073749|nr:hypothetical protein [Mycobacterium sp. AZCC_0083]MBB5161581.1 hypothetical protein [Mycobacterium sp. AZCC_0083]
MILGVVVLFFGVGGGIAKMIRDLRTEPSIAENFDPFAGLAKLLKALTAFLKAATKAPIWIFLIFVGFGLVGFGAWLIGQA